MFHVRLAPLTIAALVLLGSATAATAQPAPSPTDPGPAPSPSSSPSPVASPSPTASPSPIASPSPAASPSPTASPSPAAGEASVASAPDPLREAVATAADAQGRLPLGPDAEATCDPAAITVTFEPVPEGDFAVGGYVEPLIAPGSGDPDRATGIATCRDSSHAVAGFDAFREGDTWTVHFVSPLVESGHDHDATQGGKASSEALAQSLSLDAAASTGAAAAGAAGAIPDPPDWPSGMPTSAEPLSGSDPQDTCDPTAKPGALALTDLLTRTYATTSYGISRDCSVGGRSEHKEGRAVDWMLDATDSTERQIGDAFTSWVLGSDPWGNDHAGMRRMGIMYMIWNRQSIYSWAVDEGWRDYTGSSPHTDHVHFSMTWPGARCETSFWVATGCSGDVHAEVNSTGPGGADDLLLFRNSDRRVVSLRVGPSGTTSVSWWTNWHRQWTDIVSADLDADGQADDVLLYNADTGAYSMQAFHGGVPDGITTGTWWTGWSISAGDFDGNGVDDDLLLIRPGGRYNITHIDASGTTDRQSTGSWSRDWTHAVAADLDGDGLDDDFLLYDETSGLYSMQRVVNGEAVTHRSGRWWSGWDGLVPGDHDGDGANDDFLLFRNEDRRYNVTRVNANGTTDPQDYGYWRRSWSSLTPADLDADGTVDDVLLYNDSTGAYSMQQVTPSGPRGIDFSDWSSGWEFLPAGEFS